jgi:hypothetical protein
MIGQPRDWRHQGSSSRPERSQPVSRAEPPPVERQATHLLLEVGLMDRIPSVVSQSRCAEIRPMPSGNDLVVTVSVTALRAGS